MSVPQMLSVFRDKCILLFFEMRGVRVEGYLWASRKMTSGA
jgi:hypothetical protein